ncbi:hypothetical protein PVL29_016324 [Vitis rotundifolia]|uniref:Uncharacterized protein n=1 Tax=Vitis rotundifolia TaxID=103349 RepID=A0AA38Z7C7_VITRO|nr:hypothetical protein PVL29_016324 [Vitis rotundifolia]
MCPDISRQVEELLQKGGQRRKGCHVSVVEAGHMLGRVIGWRRGDAELDATTAREESWRTRGPNHGKGISEFEGVNAENESKQVD